MCTLHVFSGLCDDAKQRHLRQIIDDWQYNSDGGSMCLLDDHGEVYLRIQCVELRHLVACITTSRAARYLVHLRASTTAQTGVGGCHFFDTPAGDWIFAHNGVIRTADSWRYRVDSLALGESLDQCYEDGMLPDWSEHSFCNVIAHNTESSTTWIHRSTSGSLYHDGSGNWSTHRIDRNYREASGQGWFNLDGTPAVSTTGCRCQECGSMLRAMEHVLCADCESWFSAFNKRSSK